MKTLNEIIQNLYNINASISLYNIGLQNKLTFEDVRTINKLLADVIKDLRDFEELKKLNKFDIDITSEEAKEILKDIEFIEYTENKLTKELIEHLRKLEQKF